MTATNDAPDPLTTTEDRLAAIERRIRKHSSAAISTVDACLAALDALRRNLAPTTARDLRVGVGDDQMPVGVRGAQPDLVEIRPVPDAQRHR